MTTMLVLCDLDGGCIASDGTIQPKGTALNRIVAAADFNPGAGLKLALDDGRPVYAPAISAVPVSVGRWQLQSVLSQMPSKSNAGKTMLDDANTLAAAQGIVVQLAWDNAPTVERASPTINALAGAIGLSQADVDAAFVAAERVVL